jgi:hypothetical protein
MGSYSGRKSNSVEKEKFSEYENLKIVFISIAYKWNKFYNMELRVMFGF